MSDLHDTTNPHIADAQRMTIAQLEVALVQARARLTGRAQALAYALVLDDKREAQARLDHVRAVTELLPPLPSFDDLARCALVLA